MPILKTKYQSARLEVSGSPLTGASRKLTIGAKLIFLIVTLLLVFAMLFSACAKESANPAERGEQQTAVNARAIQLEPRPLEETIEVTGSLLSSAAVDVKTEFAGRVVAMRKQEGDAVSRGELIAQLEDINARLAAEQARANLEVAQAALDRARVAEEHAQTEHERAQKLLRSGGITDKDRLAAEVATRDARAQVKLAEAQVEQARQALALAQKRWNDCRIVSPIRGTVERKLLNPGSYVDAMTMLYRLVDNQRLELETFVPSAEIAKLANGQTIRFNVAPFPEEEFQAKILTISSGVQLQNRSLVVRASVPNPHHKLKAGMFVKGRIVVGTKPTALVVPAEAVWRRAGQPSFVYVIEQNRARRREVKTGIEQTNGVEIVAGLKAGDWVIAEQKLELADGVLLSGTAKKP